MTDKKEFIEFIQELIEDGGGHATFCISDIPIPNTRETMRHNIQLDYDLEISPDERIINNCYYEIEEDPNNVDSGRVFDELYTEMVRYFEDDFLKISYFSSKKYRKRCLNISINCYIEVNCYCYAAGTFGDIYFNLYCPILAKR